MLVMPGLAPGIHPLCKGVFEGMDCRVKPGNDKKAAARTCDRLRLHDAGVSKAKKFF
jgi:hypothetical protein